MAAYVLVRKKNIWDELPRHIGHVCKNKQNSSVNFLVRAEFLTAQPAQPFLQDYNVNITRVEVQLLFNFNSSVLKRPNKIVTEL